MFVRNGKRLGSVLVEETGTGPQPGEDAAKAPAVRAEVVAPEPAAEPEPADEPDEDAEEPVREDGVHHVGGGWHEVVVDGAVVDKVRGAEAAQEALDTYSED